MMTLSRSRFSRSWPPLSIAATRCMRRENFSTNSCHLSSCSQFCNLLSRIPLQGRLRVSNWRASKVAHSWESYSTICLSRSLTRPCRTWWRSTLGSLLKVSPALTSRKKTLKLLLMPHNLKRKRKRSSNPLRNRSFPPWSRRNCLRRGCCRACPGSTSSTRWTLSSHSR